MFRFILKLFSKTKTPEIVQPPQAVYIPTIFLVPTLSSSCIELLKKFEGFRDKAYQDQAGVWTIGYGTTRYFSGIAVQEGDTIDIETAAKYLKDYCDNSVKNEILPITKIHLKQHELDGLGCLVYNIGGSAFKKSTLLKKLNSQNPDSHLSILDFNKIRIKGVLTFSHGLFRRRLSETLLFLGYKDPYISSQLYTSKAKSLGYNTKIKFSSKTEENKFVSQMLEVFKKTKV